MTTFSGTAWPRDGINTDPATHGLRWGLPVGAEKFGVKPPAAAYPAPDRRQAGPEVKSSRVSSRLWTLIASASSGGMTTSGGRRVIHPSASGEQVAIDGRVFLLAIYGGFDHQRLLAR